MEENNLSQLPLIVDEHYMALIQENDVLDWEKPDAALSLADFLTYHPAVYASGHPYDALRIAHSQNLSVIPVIDNENKYIGAITRDTLLTYVAENSGIDNPGGIIVLEVSPRDYSLTEIARICENEDVLIISSQLHTIMPSGMLEVTLKTNRTDLQGITSSLERHNFKVREVFGELANKEDMEDRYKQLMNYLNM